VWPPAISLAHDVDLADLARRFRLSGGSIRNAAIDAAFRAVTRRGQEKGIHIDREDLILAIGREFQKLGRPLMRAEFGDDYGGVMGTLFTPASGGTGG